MSSIQFFSMFGIVLPWQNLLHIVLLCTVVLCSVLYIVCTVNVYIYMKSKKKHAGTSA